MAKSDYIKGITVAIGGDVSGLDKAISEVRQEISGTSKELGKVERLLKLDPKNVVLLKQKQDLLTKSIQDTQGKVNALKSVKSKADEAMKKGTQINEKEYRALVREIEAGEISLKDLRSAASKAESALSDIGDGAVKSLKDIKKSADSAADSIKKAGDESAKGGFASAVAAGNIAAGVVKGVTSKLASTVEETREYRREIGYLKTNADQAGVAFDEVNEKLNRVSAITNDSGAAIEGFSNLLEAGFSGERLDQITNNLVGAAIKWKDTLKFEGLADGLQETLATGAATGPFSEMLERMGLDLDEFNAKLETCTTVAEKQDLVLSTLASSGLASVKAEYEANNKTLIENAEAQAELNSKLSELSEKIEPILTKVTEIAIKVIDWINENPELAAGITAVAVAVVVLAGALALINTVMAASPITWIVLAIVVAVASLVAIIAVCIKHWDEIKAAAQSAWEGIQSAFASAAEWFKTKIVDPISSFFANLWKDIQNGANTLWYGIQVAVISACNFAIKAVNNMIKFALTPLNLAIDALNHIPGVNIPNAQFAFESIELPDKPAMLANGGVLSSGSAIVGEVAPELLTMVGGKAQVTPLTSNQRAAGLSFGGGVSVHIDNFTNNDTEQDIYSLTSKIMENMEKQTARRAVTT